MNTRKRGSSLLTTMVSLLGVSMIAIGVTNLSMTSNTLAQRSGQKITANGLAESGAQDLYDQIRIAIQANQAAPSSITPTAVTTVVDGKTIQVGRYSARVISATPTTARGTGTTSISSSVSGSSTIELATTTTPITKNWTFVIEGTGTAPNGTSSIVRCTFSGSSSQVETEIVTTTTTPGGSPPPSTTGSTGGSTPTTVTVPLDAGREVLQSNERIDFVVNQGIRTYDSSGSPRMGSAFANSGMTWQMQSGSKSSWVNPNVFEFQGQLLVPGNGSNAPALSMTLGASGMGNPNGTTNYRTEASTTPVVGANQIANAGERRAYPDATAVDRWRSNWANMPTRPSSTWSSSLSSSAVPQRVGDQWRVITAPAIINGDLTVEPGTQLRLMPGTSSNPGNNVIYVKGNIRNRALLYNLGVTVVCDGDYQDAASAEYRLDSQGSPLSMSQILAQSALVSTQPSPTAIQISTNSTTQYGLVYAAKGGVSITGNLEMRDSVVIAGGSGSNGGLRISPNQGNSFVIHQNQSIGGVRNWFGQPDVPVAASTPPPVPAPKTGPPTITRETSTNTAIVSPYRSRRLTGWTRVR